MKIRECLLAFANDQNHFRSRIFRKLRGRSYDGSLNETAPKANPAQIDMNMDYNLNQNTISLIMGIEVVTNSNVDLDGIYQINMGSISLKDCGCS